MKFDVSRIFIDHFQSLRTVDGKVSLSDFLILFLLPMCVGSSTLFISINLSSSAGQSLIAICSIFAALLLNLQFAMFGIFQREYNISSDPKLQEMSKKRSNDRRTILLEVNSNISYTILVCLLLCCFVLFDKISYLNSKFLDCVLVATFFHIILCILLIVKRSYALFLGEYLR